MLQPSAPPMPTNNMNTYPYVPAPYYNQVQQPQPIYYAPYFNDQPIQQQTPTATTREGCLAGVLTTLFCCCLISDVVDD